MYHLHEVSASRLEELGLHKLYQTLAQDDDETRQRFPKKENGDSLLVREDVIRTLGNSHGALWNASTREVADAMNDVHHLTLSQLLRIRTRNVHSCAQPSAALSVHRDFLKALDAVLYRRCGTRMLESLRATPMVESDGSVESGDVADMMKCGQTVVRFFGAQTFIEYAGSRCTDRGSLPSVWAFDMNDGRASARRIAFVDCTRGTCFFHEPWLTHCWIMREWSHNGDGTITWDVKNVALHGELDAVHKEMDELMHRTKTSATLSNDQLAEISAAFFHPQTRSVQSAAPLDGRPVRLVTRAEEGECSHDPASETREIRGLTPLSKTSAVNFKSSPETIEIESFTSVESIGFGKVSGRDMSKTFASKGSKFSLLSTASKISFDVDSDSRRSGARSSGHPNSPRRYGTTTSSSILRQTSTASQLTVPCSERHVSPLSKTSGVSLDKQVCAGFQFFVTSPQQRASRKPEKRVLDLSLASPPPLIPRPAMPVRDAPSLTPPPVADHAVSPMHEQFYTGAAQGFFGSGFTFCINSPVSSNSSKRMSSFSQSSTLTPSLAVGRIGTAPLAGVPSLGLSATADLKVARDTAHSKDITPISDPDTKPRQGTLGDGTTTSAVSSPPSQKPQKVRRSNTCPPSVTLPPEALLRHVLSEESGNGALGTPQQASSFLEAPAVKPTALSPMHGTHVEGSKTVQYLNMYEVNVRSPRKSTGSFIPTPRLQMLQVPEQPRGNLSPMHYGTFGDSKFVGLPYGTFVRRPSYSLGCRSSDQSGASGESHAAALGSSNYPAKDSMLPTASLLGVPRFPPTKSTLVESTLTMLHPIMSRTNLLTAQSLPPGVISPMHHTTPGPTQLQVPEAHESAFHLSLHQSNTLSVPAKVPGSSSVGFDRFAVPASATHAPIPPIYFGDAFEHASTPAMTMQNIHYHHHYHHAVPHNAAEQGAHHGSRHVLAVPSAETGSNSVNLQRFAAPAHDSSPHGMFGNNMTYHVKTPSIIMDNGTKNAHHSSAHALAVPAVDTGSSSVNLQRFAAPAHDSSPHGMFGNKMAYHVRPPSMVLSDGTRNAHHSSGHALAVPAVDTGSSSVNLQRFEAPAHDSSPHGMFGNNMAYHVSPPSMVMSDGTGNAHPSSGHVLAVPAANTGSSSVNMQRFAAPAHDFSPHGMFGNDMAYHVRPPSMVMSDGTGNAHPSSGHVLAVPAANTGSSSVNMQRFAAPAHDFSPHGMFGNDMAYHVKTPSMTMHIPTQHTSPCSTSGLTVPPAVAGSSSVNLQRFNSPSITSSAQHGVFGTNMVYCVRTPSMGLPDTDNKAVHNVSQTPPRHTAPVIAVPLAATGSSSVNLPHLTSSQSSSQDTLEDHAHATVSSPSETLSKAAARISPRSRSIMKDSFRSD